MQHTSQNILKSALKRGAVVVGAAALGIVVINPALADKEQATRLMQAMSDYLAAQQAISFEYDTTLKVVTKDNEKLGLASSGTVTLNRPDKIRVTRTGGFANVELAFDGKTMTLLGKNADVYAQLEAPGTIDQLVDELRDKHHKPVPGADLLLSDVFGELMPLVVEAKDLGSGVIRGVECDHLAFRTKEVDWQIWIAQGDRPHPCRYVITSTAVKGTPQYTLDVRDWKTGSEVAADQFSVAVPTSAKKLAPDKLDLDELPSVFAVKSGE